VLSEGSTFFGTAAELTVRSMAFPAVEEAVVVRVVSDEPVRAVASVDVFGTTPTARDGADLTEAVEGALCTRETGRVTLGFVVAVVVRVMVLENGTVEAGTEDLVLTGRVLRDVGTVRDAIVVFADSETSFLAKSKGSSDSILLSVS
jgi:hypothetical protein